MAAAKQVLLKLNDAEITANDVLIQLKATGAFKDALQEVIEGKAIQQYAEKIDKALTDKELQDAANEARRSLGLYTAKDTEAYVTKIGLTIDQWIDHLERNETRKKVMKDVITDELVENYFNENRTAYKTVYLSKIVVDDEDTADEVFTQITEEDEDFHALASKFSVDEETKRSAGSLGKTHRADLPPDAAGRVFAAEPETVLAPMEIDGQYVIFRVDAIDEELTEDLKKEIREGLFAGWINGILAQSNIETIG